MTLAADQLAAITDRLKAASSGPWEAWIEGRDFLSGSSFVRTGDGDIYLSGATTADYDFIAHARQDIANLLDEITRRDFDREG